jgi:hypothetical protein
VSGLADLSSGPMLPVRIGAAAGLAASCGFCPELDAGRTISVRTPVELVAAATQARGDGVRGLIFGSSAGLGGLVEYVRAVRAGLPDLRLVVEYWPPTDLRALGLLAAAGVTDIGIHIGSLDDDVRSRDGVPGVPLAGYERAWDEAVRLFGRYRVSTCLVVGAGEHPGELVTGAARLIARGVHPVVVPYRYGADCPPEELTPALAEVCAATAPLVRWIGQAVADMLRAVGAGLSTNSNLDQEPLHSSIRWGIR